VAEDKAGRVWAGNWIGGPYQLENEHFVRAQDRDATTSPITALYPDDQNGTLLIGSRDGVIAYEGEHSRWIFKGRDGHPANVCAVVRDPRGAIWIGLAHDGLARFENGKLRSFEKDEGLLSNSIECLYSEEDALWIGTSDRGIVRLKDRRFSGISVAQGLADNSVYHIADDGLGYFWITTTRGIQRIAKEQLIQCADGSTSAITGRLYNGNDGLPTGEYSDGLQAAGCRSSDGRLWFTSSKGLFAVDPARIQINTIVPPVVLDSFLVDGKTTAANSGAVQKKIPPDHERLEFRFTALSFTAPNKVEFRYRLEGIDKNWVDAGTRRIAYYSHLPPGSYRFHVIGSNNDGVWNIEGASLAFIVAPFFWQTWWFIAAVALSLLSAVAWTARFITRRRVEHRMKELERQNAIELERRRIARDIHDDLGGSLTQIAMTSQVDHEALRGSPQAASVLSGIYKAARDGIRALDEIVWAVNPEHDSFDSLVSYMQKYAEDFLGAANIGCRFSFPIEVPAWPLSAEARHNLFLAFKEVLNNTVKHASATEVSIQLAVQSDAFVLHIKDNGRGFDHARSQPSDSGQIISGNGLANLEQRLASISGRCEINTARGQGTEVVFVAKMSGSAILPGAPPIPH